MGKLLSSEKILVFLIFLIVIGFFFFYFKPFENDFPLPVFQTKEFFNTTFSDYYFYSQQLQKNTFPLWNPYKGGGGTFLGETQQSLFNPINLLFLKITSFPQSLKFLYLSSFLSAALGSFFYLKLLGTRPFPALLGALLFIFSGHFVSQISNLPYFQTVGLLPWVFWQTHRLALKPNLKNAVLAGMILALEVLSGPISFTFLILFLVILYMFFFPFNFPETNLIKSKNKAKKVIRSIIYFPLIVFLCFGLSAIKLLPLGEIAPFRENSLTFFYGSSYPFGNLSSLFNPFVKVNFSIFIGIVPFLSFMIIPLLVNGHLRKAFSFFIFNASLCLACFLMIIPKHSPLHILYLFPPFNFIETPLVFSTFFSWFLVLDFIILLNHLFSSKKASLAFILGACTLIEIGIFNIQNLPTSTTHQMIDSLERDYPFIQEIKKAEGKIFFLNLRPKEKIFPLEASNHLLWKIKSLNSNSSGTKRYRLLLSLIYQGIDFDKETEKLYLSSASQQLLTLNSVRYFVTPNDVSNLKPLVQQSGLNFYEMPFIPEKRRVNNLFTVDTQKELADLLRSEKFQASTSAVLENDTPSSQALLISQAYLPGWKARFNDQVIIDILPANLNQQAIIFEDQISEEFSLSFFPQSLKTGVIISLISLGFCFLLLLGSYKFGSVPSSRFFLSR